MAPGGTVSEAVKVPVESEAIVLGTVVSVAPSNVSTIVEKGWNPAPVAATRVPTGPDDGFSASVGATPNVAVATFVPSTAESEYDPISLTCWYVEVKPPVLFERTVRVDFVLSGSVTVIVMAELALNPEPDMVTTPPGR